MATDAPDPILFEVSAPVINQAPVTSAPVAATPAPAAPARKRSWGNAYTWMLILSLMFLTIGCLILLREWSMYGFEYKPV